MAATTWNRAGKVTVCRTRAMRTWPDSMGCRSVSSTLRLNSGSSSRKSTPRWARLISPGRGGLPPPMSPPAEIVWCGARKGRSVLTGWAPSSSPATEWTRVTSRDSASASGGRRPGRRRASIVLPEPGGPDINRLCPPAAAITSARLARGWPRTSPRSGWVCPALGAAGDGKGPGSRSPRSSPTTSSRERTPTMSTPGTAAASLTLPHGTNSRLLPCARQLMASAIAPRTGRTEASRPSSPTKPHPSSAAAGTCPSAVRRATATGRSKPDPDLGRSAGARLTVIRRGGRGIPLCASAAKTLSLPSRTAPAGRPTTVKMGRPFWTFTSTLTGRPSTPWTQ